MSQPVNDSNANVDTNNIRASDNNNPHVQPNSMGAPPQLGQRTQAPLAAPSQQALFTNDDIHALFQDMSDLRTHDAFLFYSSWERVMANLLGQDEVAAGQEIPPQGAIVRKTCISFEVHSSVLMEQFVFDMADLDEEEGDTMVGEDGPGYLDEPQHRQ